MFKDFLTGDSKKAVTEDTNNPLIKYEKCPSCGSLREVSGGTSDISHDARTNTFKCGACI